MKIKMLALFMATLLTACARGDNPAAVGEHNLSKGHCTAIHLANKTYQDTMTQTHCAMVGGQFTPRDLQRFVWF